MKKQILNIGKALNKAEQKQILGGLPNSILSYCGGDVDQCQLDHECPIGDCTQCIYPDGTLSKKFCDFRHAD